MYDIHLYTYLREYASGPSLLFWTGKCFYSSRFGVPYVQTNTYYLAVHAKTVGGQKAYCTPVIDWTQQVTMSILSAKLNSLRVSQSARLTFSMTGWWFGTCFIFPNSWDDDPIWPTSSFFRGVGQPPARWIFSTPKWIRSNTDNDSHSVSTCRYLDVDPHFVGQQKWCCFIGKNEYVIQCYIC